MRNNPFKGSILDWMILDLDGETFVMGIKARTAWHSPAFEHPIQLQAEIVMQPVRGMLLYKIAVSLRRGFITGRFRRFPEIALRLIAREISFLFLHLNPRADDAVWYLAAVCAWVLFSWNVSRDFCARHPSGSPPCRWALLLRFALADASPAWH